MKTNMDTYASLCTGGGLADFGAMKAGYKPIWGVESVPAIAHTACSNGIHVLCEDVRKVDFGTMERPSHLHASPPCPNFSVAKIGGEESEEDIDIASAICRAIEVLQPRTFTLENVRGYSTSKSLRLIQDTLTRLDYWHSQDVLNAADFGVPQILLRLIVRAQRGCFLPPLPATQPHRGWLEAIEDLIPTLKIADLADWQIARLPESLKQAYTLFANTNQLESKPIHLSPVEPMCTITTQAVRRPSGSPILLIMTTNNSLQDAKEGRGCLKTDHPSNTVLQNSLRNSRIFLSSGDEVIPYLLTPRCLARLQTIPDEYLLPEKRSVACCIIGNAVPCLMMEKILTDLH